MVCWATAAPLSSVMKSRRLMQASSDPSGRRVVRPNNSTVRSGAPQGQEGLSVSVPLAYLAHMLQHTLRPGFIAPYLPIKTDKLPSGDLWLHEIKHDGFRIIARKDGDRVRLYSRPGYSSSVIENPGILPRGSLSASIRALNSI
jgi:ATP-dependent DNA ligase